MEPKTIPDMLELIAQLEKSAPSVTKLLRRLEEADRSGALDAMFDLLQVFQATRATMSDAMVARLADTARSTMELMDVITTSGIVERAPELLAALTAARDEADTSTQFVKPFDLLLSPREPEIQYLLRFTMAVSRRLPKAMQNQSLTTMEVQ